MDDVDFEFIIADELVPLMEEEGIDAEYLCNLEIWMGVIEENVEVANSVLFTIVIRGLEIEGNPIMGEPSEKPPGEKIVDDALEGFPLEDAKVYFQIYAKDLE